MKAKLQYLLALSFILSCLNVSSAQSYQSKMAAESRQPLPAVTVDIKVYQCSEQGQSLLAYDPNQHSLFIFSCADYVVNWYHNGRSISNEAMLVCVEPGTYQVEVLHRASGAIGNASLWIPGPRPNPGKVTLNNY